MSKDFTLRSVVLQDADHRADLLHDLIFRDGRLHCCLPAQDQSVPRLYATCGFHDAHVHLLHEGLVRIRCDFAPARSLAEALDLFSTYLRTLPPDQPVVWGERWDESAWPERRGPSSAEIDALEPNRPVILRRICGHRAVLNTKALMAAQAELGALDPNGQLVEEQAWGLSTLWPPSAAEQREALLNGQETALSMGITRVSEMGSTGALETYERLAADGRLKMDALVYVRPERLSEAARHRSQSGLSIGGVKIFTDGSIGARTAALREGYADRTGRGLLLVSDEELCALLQDCFERQLPVAIHAIGDAALEQVVSAFESVAGERLPLPMGWGSIEHAELLDDELLSRIKRLGVTLSMQPNFVAQWGQPGGLYQEALGPARFGRMNPFGEIRRRGIPLTFGSDCMPLDPALGLRGVVHHPNPAHRLPAGDALQVFLGSDQHHPAADSGRDWWQPGAGGLVLYTEDPVLLAEGDLNQAPVRGVLWRGEWVRSVDEELWQTGAIGR